MGTLSTIGILSEGSPSIDIKNSYKSSVASALKDGRTIGSNTLAPGTYKLDGLSDGTLDFVEQKYPSWYGYYVDGLLDGIGQIVDAIPDTGILSPIGIVDPTKPIVVIIAELREILGELGSEVIEVLLSQLEIVISYSSKISSAISDKNVESFIEALSETILEAFVAAGKSPDAAINALEENKSAIETKARALMFIDEQGDPIDMPPIEIEMPQLPIPVLDISFFPEGVDPSALFYSYEIQGADGLVTKFNKINAALLTIPAKISKDVYDVVSGVVKFDEASSTIQKLVTAVRKILINFTEAIQEILDSLLGFIWDIVTSAVKLADTAFLEIASTIEVISYFVKFFIISLIGFLIGGGLIAYSAAQLFGIL